MPYGHNKTVLLCALHYLMFILTRHSPICLLSCLLPYLLLLCCSAAGSYNAGKNRDPCTTCGTGYTTNAPGQTSSTACVVQAGELPTAAGRCLVQRCAQAHCLRHTVSDG
jgi:hypothetical protein